MNQQRSMKVLAGVVVLGLAVGAWYLLRPEPAGQVPPADQKAAPVSRTASPTKSPVSIPSARAKGTAVTSRVDEAVRKLRENPDLRWFWQDDRNSLSLLSQNEILGGRHVTFQHLYAGLEVIGSQGTVHEVSGKTGFSLNFRQVSIPTTPALSPADLIQVIANRYPKEVQGASGEPVLKVLPGFSQGEVPRLVYIISVVPDRPDGYRLMVDADTGILIAKIPNRI